MIQSEYAWTVVMLVADSGLRLLPRVVHPFREISVEA